jgi:hypothetical protein
MMNASATNLIHKSGKHQTKNSRFSLLKVKQISIAVKSGLTFYIAILLLSPTALHPGHISDLNLLQQHVRNIMY